MSIKTVDVDTLKRWLDKGEAVLVDVREPAEHAARNIAGATLVPLGDITHAALPCCEGKKLVLHCQSGKRSANACQKLLSEDPDMDIYSLEGGISAWGTTGQAVQDSGRFFLPLDRQVQLAIGLLLLTGSILGYLFSPDWFLLTGAIGVGLSIAGLTGFCGLALIMARMPWNGRKAGVTSCAVGNR